MWFSSLGRNLSPPSAGPNVSKRQRCGISGLGLATYVSGFGQDWLICFKKKKKKWRTDTWFTDLEADNVLTLPHTTEHEMTIANDNLGKIKSQYGVWVYLTAKFDIFALWAIHLSFVRGSSWQYDCGELREAVFAGLRCHCWGWQPLSWGGGSWSTD